MFTPLPGYHELYLYGVTPVNIVKLLGPLDCSETPLPTPVPPPSPPTPPPTPNNSTPPTPPNNSTPTPPNNSTPPSPTPNVTYYVFVEECDYTIAFSTFTDYNQALAYYNANAAGHNLNYAAILTDGTVTLKASDLFFDDKDFVKGSAYYRSAVALINND